MKTVLFVNACVNNDRSRTDRLARELIRNLGDCQVEELRLAEMDLVPLDGKTIDDRTVMSKNGDTSAPVFDLAKKFASADIVIMASPFWESCFNSYMKIFMEYAGANGVAFRYDPNGMPIGLCKGQALYYVTTRGGFIQDEEDMGYGIVSSCARTYGFKKIAVISASGLDIITSDPDEIMEKAIAAIPSKIV